ncbi:MAG: Uma2 family endonuclease [Acidobacteria bacterium]|nr:Uma2 family endonuclease [Acidobacteriota bacterium]
MNTSNDAELTIDEMIRLTPEGKLELVSGQLLAGNGLDGSRLLLQQLLRGWGTEAAIALGSLEVWPEVWEDALAEVYQLAPTDDETVAAKRSFSALDYSRAAEGANGGHWQTCQHLKMALHQASRQIGGRALSRHYTLKLGEDGFTPDVFFYRNQPHTEFYEYYLDGPCELVIEVTCPAHENYDRLLKRDLYAMGGVLEYLIVNPTRRETEFFQLINGESRAQSPDANGCYLSTSVPGMRIKVEHLFSADGQEWLDYSPFLVEQVRPHKRESRSRRDGYVPASLPFAPRFNLHAEPILFNEYASWCPEGKFEWMDGRPIIGGHETTRNVLGLLLMSIGLRESVAMRPAMEWVAALQRHQRKVRDDAALRQQWWDKARRLAETLCEKYGIARIGVTGDLLDPKPLDYWATLELVGYDVPRAKVHLIYEEVSAFQDDLTPTIYFSEETEHESRTVQSLK